MNKTKQTQHELYSQHDNKKADWYSKLRIQSQIENFKNQKQALKQYEEIIRKVVDKLLSNKFQVNNQEEIKEDQKQDNDENYQQNAQDNQLSKKKTTRYLDDDTDSQSQHHQAIDSHLTQWPGRNNQKIFKNTTNMIQQYQKIFTKKLGTDHLKQKKISYSYRKDEKQMLQKIYLQLKSPKHNYVEFKKLYKFFDDCKLFLRVYGINPSELQDVVHCSAHKYPDKLTKEEFFELFLVNSESRNYDQLQKKQAVQNCMNEQNWNQLKTLFYQLDTFGNGTVSTKQFLHKMKTIAASKQLLQSNVLHFIAINKFYTLQKILFVLEYKKTLPQTLTWHQLQSLIINFQHIEYPTIDQICIDNITKGIIFKDTISFLLKQQILSKLKEQFERCPKFNEHFVKTKYFCEELFGSEEIRKWGKQFVRNKYNEKGMVTLGENVKMLVNQGPEYLDLDQMLTYFSVRGFQKEHKIQVERDSFDLKSTGSEEEFEERKRQLKKAQRMKSQQKMRKIMRLKTIQSIRQQCGKKPHQVQFKPTQIEQFNLTKPRDHLTIREKKLQQMLQQNQRKQKESMKSHVKANPIPASINAQRYQQQQQKHQMKRQLQRDRRQRQRQQDQKRIQYLSSNTKLFQKKPQFKQFHQSKKIYLENQTREQFQAKPISWFIKERNLLQNIQNQKEERRKNRLKQTYEKYKYGYWENMPYNSQKNKKSQEKKSVAREDSRKKKLTIVQFLEKSTNNNNYNDSLELKITEMDKLVGNQGESKKFRTTEVPDFSKLHKEFLEELESKKKMRSPTVVKEFNLSVSKRKSNNNEEQSMIKQVESKRCSPVKNKQQSNCTQQKAPESIIIGTTKKYQSMVQLNQQKRAEKKIALQIKKKQQKQRKKKKKIFANFMRQAMKQESKNTNFDLKSPSQRTTRRKDKNQKQIHQHELRKIYQRVLSRPFLFQSPQPTRQYNKNEVQLKKLQNSKKNKPKPRAQKVKIPRQNQYPHNNMNYSPAQYLGLNIAPYDQNYQQDLQVRQFMDAQPQYDNQNGLYFQQSSQQDQHQVMGITKRNYQMKNNMEEQNNSYSYEGNDNLNLSV